jgi:beta-glucosidase/6-phospho-beta-glucosidase/beta-galactosidase
VTEPIRFIGAFESTFQPAFDADVAETTGHVERWRADIDLVRETGVTELRYPIRWHRVEAERGSFDWRATDEALEYIRESGLRPIVDLLHHTSYPLWLDGFADPAFGPSFLRYVMAFAERYPWVPAYTLFNEPFTTFFLTGHEGIWEPHYRSLEGFVSVANNVMPALTAASRLCRALLPDAQHVHVEVCEHHTAIEPGGNAVVDYANDRRFLLTDLFLGRPIDESRPFVSDVRAAGGARLLALEPGSIDVLGVDYYAHNQWAWDARGLGTTCPPAPLPLAEVIGQYWERYGLPCILGETNIRGYPSDRATWLKYTLEQCERARDAGVPVEGYCWFPFVDSCDWDSILSRCDSSVDPVGVYWLDEGLERRPSSMSAAYRLAASGASSSALPAYKLQRPVSRWLTGWLPQMADWDWLAPPADEVTAMRLDDDYEIELKVVEHGV